MADQPVVEQVLTAQAQEDGRKQTSKDQIARAVIHALLELANGSEHAHRLAERTLPRSYGPSVQDFPACTAREGEPRRVTISALSPALARKVRRGEGSTLVHTSHVTCT